MSGIAGGVDTDVFDGDQAALNGHRVERRRRPPVDGGAPADLRQRRRADLGGNDGADLGDNSAGTGGGGGAGGGNGDTGGGKGDQPGTMPHGCSFAATRGDAPAPLALLVIALVVVGIRRKSSSRLG